MKTSGLFILTLFFALALSANNESKLLPFKVLADSVEVAKGDSTEYELLIFDPAFESWFTKNQRPKWFYENS